jgi:hypothetical protein
MEASCARKKSSKFTHLHKWKARITAFLAFNQLKIMIVQKEL